MNLENNLEQGSDRLDIIKLSELKFQTQIIGEFEDIAKKENGMSLNDFFDIWDNVNRVYTRGLNCEWAFRKMLEFYRDHIEKQEKSLLSQKAWVNVLLNTEPGKFLDLFRDQAKNNFKALDYMGEVIIYFLTEKRKILDQDQTESSI